MKNIDRRKTSTGRQLAVSALYEMEKGGYSNIVISKYLNETSINSVEKNFATQLFYGTLERKLTLEFVMNKYLQKKPDLIVKVILLTGFYQLIYLDGVKDYGVVDETVKLCRFFGVSSATGFVNAILRNFLRDGKEIDIDKSNYEKHLSIKYSCGIDIVKALVLEFGKEESEKILEESIAKPRIYARVNTLKTDRESLIKDLKNEGIESEPSEILEETIYFKGQYSLEKSKVFKAGHFHIQDLSSQLAVKSIANLFDKDKNYNILDTCSAPGGKSFTIAQEFFDKSTITALDIYDFKLGLINKEKNRLSIENIETKLQNGEELNEDFLEKFDIIICDMPCSGIGIIKKKPEIKYKKRKDFSGLPGIQKRILENSAKYLKPGGVLLYSTCTLFKEENDRIVDGFLDSSKGYSGIEGLDILKKCSQDQRTKGVTILPKDFNSDGFYIGLIKKEI